MKFEWKQLVRTLVEGTTYRRRKSGLEYLFAMASMVMTWLTAQRVRSVSAKPADPDPQTTSDLGSTIVDERLTKFATQREYLYRRIASLDAQIDEIDEALAKQHSTVARMRRALVGIERRLRMRQVFGTPSSRFVLVVGLLSVGAAISFIFTHMIFGSWQLAMVVVLAIELGLMIVARSYLYSPSDSLLLAKQASVRAELNPHEESLQAMSQRRFKLVTQRSGEQGHLYELNRKIAQYRDALLNTSERMALLQLDWRSFRAIDFERFLEQVFRSLGYDAQLQGRSGDQGVDLLVTSGQQKWAIQAKGYEGTVSNGAVQEIVAGMNHYRCTNCAVVTNSVFTKSARELAESNNCLLIDGELLGDLLHGRIPAFPLAYRPSTTANRQASAGDS